METKNILIGGGVLLAALYLINKNKKPAAQEATEELPSGGGGGFPFPTGGVPIPTPSPKPTPTPTPTPTVPKPVVVDKGTGGSIVRCPSGYLYDPVKRACVPYAQTSTSKDTQAPEGSGRAAYEAAKKASAGLGAAPTTGSTGTTSGTTTGTGSSSGGLSGSGVQNQPRPSGTTTGSPITTTPTSGTTCPPNYFYNRVTRKCVKEIVGQTSMRFSGKEPLTLDNILC